MQTLYRFVFNGGDDGDLVTKRFDVRAFLVMFGQDDWFQDKRIWESILHTHIYMSPQAASSVHMLNRCFDCLFAYFYSSFFNDSLRKNEYGSHKRGYRNLCVLKYLSMRLNVLVAKIRQLT